jgi:hypothetical protein
MMILLGQRLLAVDLVEVVLLSDNVQDLRRVLAVVGGVPLAYVLHPEQELLWVSKAIKVIITTTTVSTAAAAILCLLEHPDHSVGAIVHVLEVPDVENHGVSPNEAANAQTNENSTKADQINNAGIKRTFQ